MWGEERGGGGPAREAPQPTECRGPPHTAPAEGPGARSASVAPPPDVAPPPAVAGETLLCPSLGGVSLALGSEAEMDFFQPEGCEKHYSRTLLSVSSPLFLFIMI